MTQINLSNLFAVEDQFLAASANLDVCATKLAEMFAEWLGLPDYAGYTAKRSEYIEARKQVKPTVSEEAHNKSWERNVSAIASRFEYVKPKAESKEAVKKSEQREKAEAQARQYLADKGSPSLAQVQQAAVAKLTASDAEQRKEAAIILQADKLAKADAKAKEADIRKAGLELWKTADLKHMELAIAALKVALPQGATASIEVKAPEKKAPKAVKGK